MMRYWLGAVMTVLVVVLGGSCVVFAQQATIDVGTSGTDAQSVTAETPSAALGVPEATAEKQENQQMQGSVPPNDFFKQQIINERSSQPVDPSARGVVSKPLVYATLIVGVCTAICVVAYLRSIHKQRPNKE